jgi:hypothetical protein
MSSLTVLRTYRLAAPYGLRSRAHLVDRATPTYADLSEQALVELVGDEPVDLIALANLVPEVDPRRAIANQLSSRFATEPLTFGVSDHGTAAPFTAVAILLEYVRAGLAHRPALVVLEQATLPYEVPAGVPVPARDSIVVLLFGSAGTAGTAGTAGSVDGTAVLSAVRVRGGVTAASLADDLAVELTALPRGPEPVTYLAAPAVAASLADRGLADPADVRVTPDGLLATATWWALADELDAAAAHRVVLVDHDAARGQLSVAAVDVR